MKTSRLALAAFALLSSLSVSHNAAANDDRVSFSAGYFDVVDHDDSALDLRAEYRWGTPVVWGIKPYAGVEGTTDGALYGLAGLYWDFAVTPEWYITPSLGAGVYSDGDGKDLGSALELRSQVEVSYEFESRDRVGLGFSHISNAGIGDENPGTEVLSLYYHMPVSRFFGE